MRMVYDQGTDASYAVVDRDYDGYDDDLTPVDADHSETMLTIMTVVAIAVGWWLVSMLFIFR